MEVQEEEENEAQRIETLDPEEEEEDRISLLPDALIIDEILPRLQSTKSAIRTGALSKRWQHLWPSVSCLHFNDSDFKEYSHYEPLPYFYLSVDKTLAQCQSKNLKKFSVTANYDSQEVDNWVRFAIRNKVPQLHLELRFMEDSDEFVFKDDAFFVNSHFTRLHLEHCVFNPSGPISWKNLTHLTIGYGRLDHGSIEHILSGCPLLETLKLCSCFGYSRLNITSKSVKNLVLCGYDDPDDIVCNLNDVIEINAPYVSSLEVSGTFLLWMIVLRDVSSLVKAELNYTKLGYDVMTRKEEREDMLKRFVLRLRHVKELKIGTLCYAAFSRLEAKGFIFPSNLKVIKPNCPVYDTDDSIESGDCSDNDSSAGDTAVSMLVTQIEAWIRRNECLMIGRRRDEVN